MYHAYARYTVHAGGGGPSLKFSKKVSWPGIESSPDPTFLDSSIAIVHLTAATRTGSKTTTEVRLCETVKIPGIWYLG